jgi:thymidine kinase
MAKLYFRYGTMGSAKTLNLLAVAHNYRQQGKKVLLLKPSMDARFGTEKISSRAGLEMEADLLVSDSMDLFKTDFSEINCILVDEAQFFSIYHVEQLRDIALLKDIPVICYGLRTDFKSKLFPGSMRLMELADSIEEIKATCFFCNKKSTMNLRHVDGRAAIDGPTIQLGAEESYYPVCYLCYYEQIKNAREALVLF